LQYFYPLQKRTPASRSTCRPTTLAVLFVAWAIASSVHADSASRLENPGFEAGSADGTPAGWNIVYGLDKHRYGPPDLKTNFDAVRPTVGTGGRFSSACLAFPASGTWSCPVFTQSNGDGKHIDGRPLGKAAAFQTVELPAGRYRFSAWLRTAEGHLFSAAFSLGVNIGPRQRPFHRHSLDPS
jgi:hypothetical protein